MAEDAGSDAAQLILGRARELDRIDEMVRRLANGRGSVAVLIGPPGIGLTTLLEEAIRRAVGMGGVRAVHVPSGLLEGGATAVLAASAAAGDALRGSPDVVGQVLGESGGAVAPDDPRLVQAAVSGLRTLSSERPLLVTVDNLPVGEGAVFTAMASLAAGIIEMPVLVVATSHVLPRSSFEESPVGPLWVRRLPPLGTADAVALVRATAETWVPHPVAAAVAHRTGGNPGDIVGVCAALDPDRLSGVEPLPEPLPGTVTSAATYRRWWEALGAKERLLVLGAGLVPNPDRATLEECAGVTLADVEGPDGDVALGEEHGLVVARDPRLLSAVSALTPPRETRAALAALAACYPEDSLDRHWLTLRAGEQVTPEVLDRLVEGARSLLDRGEVAAVQTLVGDVVQRRGRSAPSSLDLLLLGGAAAMYCGHPARAVTLLTTALAEAPDGLGRTLPLLLLAMTYRENGVPHRLLASSLPQLEPSAAAAVAAQAARLCAEYGDVDGAAGYLHQAQALAPTDVDEEAAGLPLTRAMVEHHGRPMPAADPLAFLGVSRPGVDIAGWLTEFQGVGLLVQIGEWSRARGELTDLHARVRRFPAPLLRAHLALESVRLHLSTCEYRRADEVAAAAVKDMLPLHVPWGGTGVALLAHVALLRGRAEEAERWLTDAGEVAHGVPGTTVQAAALHETLGLRALLADDHTAAAEHYSRARRAGRVLTSTVLDLVHLSWLAEEDPAGVAGDDGDAVLAAAGALLGAAPTELVDTVDSVAQGIRDTVLPAHEAQLLELAADRLGALTTDEAVPAGSGGRELPRHERRLQLLRRARDLYRGCGASARADRTERRISVLEGATTVEDGGLTHLTEDELTIARMVHRGATNKEVAAALYISVRTVELRLTSTYRKLGIGSRRELRQLASLAP